MRDYHVHSTFSDGKSTAEEVVLSAVGMGVDTLGFSDHSWAEQDIEGEMHPETYPLYRAEIARLKEKYKGRIRILCGIEQDYDSKLPAEGFDFIIGSVHYIRKNGTWFSVDWKPEATRSAAKDLYGGDPYALCEDYFEKVAKLADMKCDIYGHFDLVSKFCEKDDLFDPMHPRYIAAAKKALDRLLKTGTPFEINTGAISRGWRTTPYPAPVFRKYIREHGGKLILSSDSHRADTLCNQFEIWRSEADDIVL
ncbi:MAG: histidinol phosphate phosphatase [Clostridiales bacterium]|nr:histidinol phosphate phosphatase [Clostridiales bacterium]